MQRQIKQPMLAETVPNRFSRHSRTACWGCGAIVMLISSAYGAAISLHGLDMTDEGFHIMQHWLILNAGDSYSFGYLWLSELTGSFWLWLLDDLGLYGARLGWAITTAATALVSYCILLRYFRPFQTLLALLVTTVILTHQGILVTNQNNVAGFFLLVAAGFCLNAELPYASDSRRNLSAILAGLAIAACIMARYPLLAAVALPLVAPLTAMAIKREFNIGNLKRAFLAIAAAGVGFVALLAALFVAGRFSEYTSIMLFQSVPVRHGSMELLEKYLVSTEEMLGRSLLLVFGLLLVGIASVRISRILAIPALAPVAFALGSLSWFGLILIVFGRKFLQEHFSLLMPGVCVVAACFCLFAFFAQRNPSWRTIAKAQLLLVGCALGPLIMLGTNNTTQNLRYGLWLAYPTVILLMVGLSRATLKTFAIPSARRAHIRGFVVASVAVLTLCALGDRFAGCRRDLPNRLEMTATFAHPRLRYIKSSPGRVASLDELCEHLGPLISANESLLVYNVAPMVHYLTSTRPVMSSVWPEVMGPERIARELAELGTSRPLPRLVVRAKANMRSRYWGNQTNVTWPPRNVLPGIDLIDADLHRRGYVELWANRDFQILHRPQAATESHDESMAGENAS